jgi:tripartite-type tricarboxylate transporter receptor subunit TctC
MYPKTEASDDRSEDWQSRDALASAPRLRPMPSQATCSALGVRLSRAKQASGNGKAMRWLGLAAALAAASLGAVSAAADPVAEFYKGKQLQFIIRSGVGGGYDQYARLLGRHIGRNIPGNPTVLPVNMPGGGGIVAANFVATKAPRDGTILTIVSQGLPVDQALGLNKSLQADLRSFNWIGNLSDSNQVLVTWHTSATKSLEDAKKRETIIGSTQAGSISVQLPAFYNSILKTRLRIVFGYPDGTDVNIAMERGEVEGRGTNPWASYQSTTPDWVRDKKVIPIIQVGLKKDPGLPDVPLLRDLATSPDEQLVLDYMSKAVAVGRPVATTPGVPDARVAALRRAFDVTLADPEFIKEADAQRAEISAMSGEQLAQIIADLIEAPQSVRDKVKTAMEPPRDAREVKGQGKSKEQ